MDVNHKTESISSSVQGQSGSSTSHHDHGNDPDDKTNEEIKTDLFDLKIKSEPVSDDWIENDATISGNATLVDEEEDPPFYIKMEPSGTSDFEDEAANSNPDKETIGEVNTHGIMSSCEVCSIEFDELSQFISHMFLVHSNLHSVSESSEEDADVNNSSSGHEESQKKKHPFTCKYCERTFKHNHSLSCHIHQSHGKEDEMETASETSRKNLYECKLCDKGFSDKKFNLKRHFLAVHNSVKNYCCLFEGCNQVYKQEWELRRHQRAVHAIQRSALVCEQCSQRFTSTRNLRIHKKFKHGGSHTPDYMCHLCKKGFHFPWRLKRHLEVVHSNIKPHQCKSKGCNKAFKEKSALKRHMLRVHDTELT